MESLSGGQRRRLDIAKGLVGRRRWCSWMRSTGLDPQSRANLWVHVADLRDKAGVTLFLTTHYLEEADALCDRIWSSTTRPRRGRHAGPAQRRCPATAAPLRLTDPTAPPTRHGGAALPDADEPGVDGDVVHVRVPNGSALPGRGEKALDRAAVEEVRRPTLDDVFLSLTGRSLRDAEAPAETEAGGAR